MKTIMFFPMIFGVQTPITNKKMKQWLSSSVNRCVRLRDLEQKMKWWEKLVELQL